MRTPKHPEPKTGTRVPVRVPSFLLDLPPAPVAAIQSSKEIAEHVTSLAWMAGQDHPIAADAKKLLAEVYGGRFLTVEDAKRVRVWECEFTNPRSTARATQTIELEEPLDRAAIKKSLRKRLSRRAIA